MTSNRRNCCSSQWEIPILHFPQEETFLLRGFLVGYHSMWNREIGKKASRVFLLRSELCLSCYQVLGRAVLVTHHNSSAFFLHPWFWKTLKHMYNIWNMCLITIHCFNLKVDCERLILTQNNSLHFSVWSRYKVQLHGWQIQFWTFGLGFFFLYKIQEKEQVRIQHQQKTLNLWVGFIAIFQDKVQCRPSDSEGGWRRWGWAG